MNALLDSDISSPIVLATRKVGANCHIGFSGAYYSVPSSLYKEMVIVRASDATIEILNSEGKRVASHKRSYSKRKYITDPEHMPSYYLSLLLDSSCYDGAQLRNWAKDIGEYTSFVIEHILKKAKIEEHAYKSCMAILQLSKKYGSRYLERACEIAFPRLSCSYSSIKNILLEILNRRFSK